MVPQLTPEFEDTPAGRKRSVFFAIGVATGFICIVAATTVLYQSRANTSIATILIILGSIALGFSTMTGLGRLEWLFENE